MNELERFQTNKEQGQAPGLWLTLVIGLGEHPDETVAKVLSVIGYWLAVVERVEKNQEPWPDDEQWSQHLPDWFIATFQRHTREEIHESDWLWDYGSWLDSMRDRVWQWWGYQRHGQEMTIQLQLDSWPYSIGTLRYLVRTAGGHVIAVEE